MKNICDWSPREKENLVQLTPPQNFEVPPFVSQKGIERPSNFFTVV